MEQEKSNGIGGIAGIIIVIAILVIGGFYFVGQRIEKQKQFEATVNSASTSDEIVDLQKDASSTNFDNLGTGIDQL